MSTLLKILPLGEPAKRIKTPKGTISMWSSRQPFLVTHMEGYADKEIAVEIESFYKHHASKWDDVVTVHDWSNMTDYDAACRRILQQLTHFMRDKQREIVIHLGPADSLGQKVIRTTAETITRFRKMPIEIFGDDESFSERVRQLAVKYEDSMQRHG